MLRDNVFIVYCIFILIHLRYREELNDIFKHIFIFTTGFQKYLAFKYYAGRYLNSFKHRT